MDKEARFCDGEVSGFTLLGSPVALEVSKGGGLYYLSRSGGGGGRKDPLHRHLDATTFLITIKPAGSARDLLPINCHFALYGSVPYNEMEGS